MPHREQDRPEQGEDHRRLAGQHLDGRFGHACNPVGRPNSLSHTAIPTPTGNATAIAIAPTITVPSNGSRKPPV